MSNTPNCNCNKPFRPQAVGSIKNIMPECPVKAVIPSITVENTVNLKGLAGCLVHVTQNNTTYYINERHEMMIVWAGPLDIDDYDYVTNPRNLRNQTVFDFSTNRVIRYDAQGQYRIIKMEVA